VVTYISADERRPVILAAARRVCERDGLAKLSMRAVAVEAGIPLGTLQYVFPTRTELLQGLVAQVDDEIDAALRSTPPGTAGLAATLRVGLTAFWERMVAHQIGLQLLQYELTLTTLRTKGLHGIAAWQYRRYTELLAQWFRETAEAAGETLAIGHQALARQILAAIDGLILQYVVDPDPARAAADLETIIATWTAYAAPRPA
jgi:DNA-binding transcriptional regulator YbjK